VSRLAGESKVSKKYPGRWWDRITLFIASLILTFLVIEVFLFFFTDLRRYEVRLSVSTNNGWMQCYPTNPRKYFPISYIDPESGRLVYCVACDPAKRKKGYFPERKEQAALVGDSFTLGEGVKDEDTLAYLLDVKFPQINFRNFGESGAYISDIQIMTTEILKSEKQIRNIIYFYNLNDVMRYEEAEKMEHYITDFQNLSWYSMHHNFLTSILSKSTMFRLLEKGIVLRQHTQLTIQNYREMYFERANAKELEESLQKLVEMNVLAKENGARLFVVLYPLMYKDTSGIYPFTAIHQFLANFCKEHGIRCLDGIHAFAAFPSLQPFTVHAIDYHPNELANRQMINYLIQAGELDLAK